MTKRIRLTKRELDAIEQSLRAVILGWQRNGGQQPFAHESAYVKITRMRERVSKGWRDE